MSDETFQRPGSSPAPHRVAPPGDAKVWQPDAVAAAQAGPASSSALEPNEPAAVPHRPLPHSAAIFGIAGLFIGLAAGAATGFFLHEPPASPIAITLDDFPPEILGQQRDDLQWRDAWSKDILERLDAKFRSQVTAYRFAYGGDGASLSYGNDEFSLTIVNAQLPNPTVTDGDDPSTTIPTAISLESEQTACVSEEPPREEPRPFELSEILVDDSKDVFFWLDEGRIEARTECVLFDEDRHLSLRLDGSGWVDNNDQTAGWLRDELVEIHADLTD